MIWFQDVESPFKLLRVCGFNFLFIYSRILFYFHRYLLIENLFYIRYMLSSGVMKEMQHNVSFTPLLWSPSSYKFCEAQNCWLSNMTRFLSQNCILSYLIWKFLQTPLLEFLSCSFRFIFYFFLFLFFIIFIILVIPESQMLRNCELTRRRRGIYMLFRKNK